MAREHDQKRTNGQKLDLNEIQPGMEVEDTGHELGEGDISKPRVSNVIRDKQGQVKYVIIGKGLLFKKMVLVPANRIKEVRRESALRLPCSVQRFLPTVCTGKCGRKWRKSAQGR